MQWRNSGELMGKTDVKRTPEENKERHEFRKKLREEQQEWEEQMYREQLDEVRGIRLLKEE